MPRAPRKQYSCRRWCFTLNNPVRDDYPFASQWVTDNIRGLVRYCVISLEHANQEGKTPHWQGYIELTKPQRLSYFKKLRPFSRAHFESAKGTGKQNRAYITKEVEPWLEEGEPGGKQGRRTDLEECKLLVESGASELEVAQAHFGTWMRYNRSLKAYKQLIVPRRMWKTEVIVRWGPAGSGKSRWVWENVPDVCDMWHRNNFWSPYNNQENVLWDDFDPSVVSRQEFLTLTDRYPTKIRQMNGWAEWVPKVIYITSNTNPALWYGGDNAVKRRLTNVTEISITSVTSVTDTE